jgi:hypothetical protein
MESCLFVVTACQTGRLALSQDSVSETISVATGFVEKPAVRWFTYVFMTGVAAKHIPYRLAVVFQCILRRKRHERAIEEDTDEKTHPCPGPVAFFAWIAGRQRSAAAGRATLLVARV